jgi:hypothetical protein
MRVARYELTNYDHLVLLLYIVLNVRARVTMSQTSSIVSLSVTMAN